MSHKGPPGAMGKPGDRRETLKERIKRYYWNGPWNKHRRYLEGP